MLLDVKAHGMRRGKVFTAFETSIGMNLDIMSFILVIFYEAHTFGMAWQGAKYGAGFRLRPSLVVKVRDFGNGYEGSIRAVAGRVVFVFGLA